MEFVRIGLVELKATRLLLFSISSQKKKTKKREIKRMGQTNEEKGMSERKEGKRIFRARTGTGRIFEKSS
jgi:hypothetical protein